MPSWSALFGKAAPAASLPFSVAVGTAVGGAAAGALTPGVQALINQANSAFPLKPPSYFMMAEGVAKGRVDAGWAAARANEQGISTDAFDRLVSISKIGPGLDVAFELWRRKLIGPAGFARAVKEETIDDDWLPTLEQLHDRLLTPPELANARQQEFIQDDRLHSEGELQGYTNERMDLMFKMAGLPPGVMDALTMLRRGIIDEGTYAEIVAEGHTKTKYTNDLLGLKWHVVSGEVAAGLRLRGWKTKAESDAIGALDGWRPEELEYLYLNRGRPAAPGQMYTAIARKIDGPDGTPMDYPQFLKGIQESDIRTEWAPLLWGIRHLYPSLFQLNRLVTGGAISPDVGADWATKARYAPEVVAALLKSWSGAAPGASAKWAGRAQSRLYTVTHNEYVAGSLAEPDARTLLAKIGCAGAEQNTVVSLWNDEKGINRLELTPAEIRREYRKNIISLEQATAELENRGMTPEDIATYLPSSGTAV